MLKGLVAISILNFLIFILYLPQLVTVIKEYIRADTLVSDRTDILVGLMIKYTSSSPGQVTSGHPFRKHPDSVSEISGQPFGFIRTPCRADKLTGTL